MSIASSFSEKAGPLPVWVWVLGIASALYFVAHRANRPGNTTIQGNPTYSPLAGGRGALFGSPAALAGPVLQPNPTPPDAINQQTGAALAPNATYIPNAVPPVGGGDIPTVAGYVGLPGITNYVRARGGPS